MENGSTDTTSLNQWVAAVIKERRDYLYREQQYIFQRFNYFLIGTAFLITAFAALVASQKYCPNGEPFYIYIITYAIGFLGLIMGSLFTVINFLVTYSNKNLSEKTAVDLTLNLSKWTTLSWNETQMGGWPKALLCSMFLSIFRPFDDKIRGLSSHVFMFPLLFACFWSIALTVLSGLQPFYMMLIIIVLGVIVFGFLWHLLLFLLSLVK
jgi:hypothetical protein